MWDNLEIEIKIENIENINCELFAPDRIWKWKMNNSSFETENWQFIWKTNVKFNFVSFVWLNCSDFTKNVENRLTLLPWKFKTSM